MTCNGQSYGRNVTQYSCADVDNKEIAHHGGGGDRVHIVGMNPVCMFHTAV